MDILNAAISALSSKAKVDSSSVQNCPSYQKHQDYFDSLMDKAKATLLESNIETGFSIEPEIPTKPSTLSVVGIESSTFNFLNHTYMVKWTDGEITEVPFEVNLFDESLDIEQSLEKSIAMVICFKGLGISRMIRNKKATILFFQNGEKTVVRLQVGDRSDNETGLLMALSKYLLGNKYDYFKIFTALKGDIPL